MDNLTIYTICLLDVVCRSALGHQVFCIEGTRVTVSRGIEGTDRKPLTLLGNVGSDGKKGTGVHRRYTYGLTGMLVSLIARFSESEIDTEFVSQATLAHHMSEHSPRAPDPPL